jgi:CheY-like chemotaxis protein
VLTARILICENEDSLRGLIRDSLEDGGYEFVEAVDGDEAIAKARAERPDLVLLDMMMPGRTGLEVLSELRAEGELVGTRVVMLTARAQAADREAAAAAGVDRFVAKPFSPSQLAALVAELLGETS